MVPKGWHKTLIGSVCDLSAGVGFPIKYQGFKDKPILAVKVSDMNLPGNEKEIVSAENTIDESMRLEMGSTIFHKGCIIFPKVGAALLTNKRRLLIRPTMVDNNIMVLIPKNAMSEFIFYWSQLIDMKRYSQESALPSVSQSIVRGISIMLPPDTEQQQIVTIIEAWDEAIGKNIKLLELITKFKQALMQQLLTGKLRFREFIKSNKKTKTNYGLIPADWKYPQVEEIADEVSDRNENGRNIPVLSCTKYDGLVDSLRYFGKRIFSENTSAYKIVRRDQFAYATNHIEEGSIGLLDSLNEGLVSPMYTVFKTNENVYAPYLYKVFKTELYRHIFEVNTSGSIDRRGSLRWKQFCQIHIPLPSIKEQKKISACVDTCDREIKLLQQLMDALKTQKKGLMQKLLTGQIRVKM